MKNYILIMVVMLCLGFAVVPHAMAREDSLQPVAAMAQEGAALVEPAEAIVPVELNEPMVWPTLSYEKKVELITDAIKTFRTKKGVRIRKEAGFYVDQIDGVYIDNPGLGDDSVGSILRMLMITHRDFDKGQGPDEVIRAELGEEKYQKAIKNKAVVEEMYQEYLRGKEG